jgi:hypothetical protein
MEYKLTFFEQIYYLCTNNLIFAEILDHPGIFSILVNSFTIKETFINIIVNLFYIHGNTSFFNILTFLYLCFYFYNNFYNNLILLIKVCASNAQLIALSSLDNCLGCLKLLIKHEKYVSIYATFTNLNLKNLFIMSATFIYIFYLLNFNEMIFLIWKHFACFLTKSNFTNNIYDLFYLKYEFVDYYNIQLVFLTFCLLTIILHSAIGLYMLFFDYFKQSSLFLWTLLIYLIIIFILVFFFNNENLYVNFINILQLTRLKN